MRCRPLLLALALALPIEAVGRPLGLDEVLAVADAAHPDLDVATAQRELAEAEQALAESLNDARINLEGTLRGGRNPVLRDRFEPDNSLRLNLRKNLFDSGRSEAAISAARLEAQARSLQWLDTKAQRRIALMSRFFDVLLADLRYTADNEFMTVAYLRWDDDKQRQELGMRSAVEVATLEATFQDARIVRNEAERKMREKRLALAAAMNRINELPSELDDPRLSSNERPLPEFDVLLARTLAENPRLAAQKQLRDAAQNRLASIRAENRPSLEFEAEAATWSRDAATRDELRAGVNLVWPLYQGKRVDARIAKEQAQFHLLQAQYEGMKLDLQQALYAAWQEIQQLRETGRNAAAVNAAYRDVALEQARAVYELELQTKLGTAMAETQAALWRRRTVEYRLALAWAKLEALLGSPIDARMEKGK